MLKQYNCPKCNAPVVSNDKNCWHCGAANTWSAKQQTAPPPKKPAPEPSTTEYVIESTPLQQSPIQQPSSGYSLEPLTPVEQQPRSFQHKPSTIVSQPISDQNTSGYGSLASMPPEIRHWNWGAFFLTWIWGIGNPPLPSGTQAAIFSRHELARAPRQAALRKEDGRVLGDHRVEPLPSAPPRDEDLSAPQGDG